MANLNHGDSQRDVPFDLAKMPAKHYLTPTAYPREFGLSNR